MASSSLGPVFAAAASLISLLFGVQLAAAYLKKRKPYQIWWSAAMILYAISGFEEFWAPLFGWSAFGYRLYYFCAIALVPVMAAGQVHMSFSKRTAGIYQTASIIALVLFAVFLLREPLQMDVLRHVQGTVAGAGMLQTSIPRMVFAPVLDGIGGLLLILLPILSWLKTRRTAPLFVALGSVLLSLAGTITHLGLQWLLPIAELAGIWVIYYGVGRSSEHPHAKTGTS